MPFTAFDIILISPEEDHPEEWSLLTAFFEAGLETFHLRKPHASKSEIKNYLNNIPKEFHHRIMLHQHHDLIDEFNLKGLHFPANKREEATHYKGFKSTSFHDLETLKNCKAHFRYAFLSPIFPSISKANYQKAWNVSELKFTIQKAAFPIIALGGINKENIQKSMELGFNGVAVLGTIWQNECPTKEWENLSK